MSILAASSAKLRGVAQELTKFGTVGAIALVVNFVATNAMWYVLPHSKITGSIIGTVIATVVSYIGNRYWTYKDRESIGKNRELILFAVVNAIGMLIETMPIAVCDYVLDMNGSILASDVAKYIFGVPLGMLFRLWTYRTWIFPKVDPAAAAAQYQYDAAEPLPTSQLPTVGRRSGSGDLMRQR